MKSHSSIKILTTISDSRVEAVIEAFVNYLHFKSNILIERITSTKGDAHLGENCLTMFISLDKQLSEACMPTSYSQNWLHLYETAQNLPQPGLEGYRIVSSSDAGEVLILAADQRGVLYGLGRVLRVSSIYPSAMSFPDAFSISATPASKIRGMQLGYRPKTNAYDMWSKEQYLRYIWELAFFGANTIELLPPRTDDILSIPEMLYDPLEMLCWLSAEIDTLGLDVSIWYPNLIDDITDPKAFDEALREREEIFSSLARIDYLMVPGGDPGELPIAVLFDWMERVHAQLTRFHPHASIWLSPQFSDCSPSNIAAFYAYISKRPYWLAGIVHGPWVKGTVSELRQLVPMEYPIRRYPDICHSFNCQHPVWNWDPAFLITLGREGYNPRPRDYKRIHNADAAYAVGSIAYSEGINDDINKFIWLDQEWDPHTNEWDTLKDYVRLFINPDLTSQIAKALMRFETHWDGPIARNMDRIHETFLMWDTLYKSHAVDLNHNYRFIMPLLRVYCDEYIRCRWIWEHAHQEELLTLLQHCSPNRLEQTLEESKSILQKGVSIPFRQLREGIDHFADKAFDLIRWQTSVIRHHAKSIMRGAFVDAVDKPISDLVFLQRVIDHTQDFPDPQSACEYVYQAIARVRPRPGSVFMNFQFITTVEHASPNLISRNGTSEGIHPYIGTISAAYNTTLGDMPEVPMYPIIEQTFLTADFGQAFTVVLKDLEYGKRYTLQLCYARNHKRAVGINLRSGPYEIHSTIELPGATTIREFSIPVGAITHEGTLSLTWQNRECSIYGGGVAWLSLSIAH